jgi:hypothetical protein
MRALEDSYEKKLREARESVVRAEQMAREAARGIVAVDAEAAREGEYAASSVERASAASEMAMRMQYEAQNENAMLRHQTMTSQYAQGEAEARVVQREAQVRELSEQLEKTRNALSGAVREAEGLRTRAEAAEAALEASQDQVMTTQVALERAASECTRLQEETTRLREHSRELAQGPAARPRVGGAPLPAAMQSAQEWEALREERDSLVHLLVEMRRASERAAPSKAVRVGGGYTQLPDYLSRLTGALPPELKLTPRTAQTHPTVDDTRHAGLAAPTHRSMVRSLSARGPLNWKAGGHGGSSSPGRAPGPARHAVFGPGRPVGVLVHQQGPPHRHRAPAPAPAPPGGAMSGPPGDYSMGRSYPAVGRKELFEVP